MTVLDVIDYCLALAVHPQSPPYFYVQRMLDHKAMLISFFSENEVLFNKNNFNFEWSFTKANLEDVQSSTGISEQLSTKNKIYDVTVAQGHGRIKGII